MKKLVGLLFTAALVFTLSTVSADDACPTATCQGPKPMPECVCTVPGGAWFCPW